MDVLLRLKHPVVINKFTKITDEQLGKIVRSYIYKNPKGLKDDEVIIYQELCREEEKYNLAFKERTRKGWETRRKNGNGSLKEKMALLQAENEELKNGQKSEKKIMSRYIYKKNNHFGYASSYNNKEGVFSL